MIIDVLETSIVNVVKEQLGDEWEIKVFELHKNNYEYTIRIELSNLDPKKIY